MSEEAQREEKKVLLFEWRENEQELARQHAMAAKMADLLYYVATTLRSEPEKLIFSGDSTPAHYLRSQMIADASCLDVAPIRGVRDAVRALLDRQRNLKPRMAAFGLL